MKNLVLTFFLFSFPLALAHDFYCPGQELNLEASFMPLDSENEEMFSSIIDGTLSIQERFPVFLEEINLIRAAWPKLEKSADEKIKAVSSFSKSQDQRVEVMKQIDDTNLVVRNSFNKKIKQASQKLATFEETYKKEFTMSNLGNAEFNKINKELKQIRFDIEKAKLKVEEYEEKFLNLKMSYFEH